MRMILWLERILWSGPLLMLLTGSHVYFTAATGCVQRHTLRGIRLSVRPRREENGVSSFGALATSLAAAIGTGNIIGIATAVALGGPGALLWCWFTGVFGMATRYGESYLSLRHRRRLPGGGYVGGPMYVMEERLHSRRLGQCFAFLGVAAAVGTGALIQANAIGTTLLTQLHVPLWISGAAVTLGAGLVILGGVKTISSVCEKMVPAMSALYLFGCLWVLIANRAWLPETLNVIVRAAFTPRAAGGGFVGSTVLTAARYGTARGLFTNESGMGTAPLAAVTGPCDDPAEEALISMTGVFWDTVVICALTGLVIVSGMLRDPALFAGATPGRLCYLAFSLIPGGAWILTVSLVVFAFATIVGWCWYGESCCGYLWGDKAILPYRICYLISTFLGVFGGLEAVWSLGGILAGLMAAPNLICLFRLRKEVAESGRKIPRRRTASCHMSQWDTWKIVKDKH